MYYDIQIEDSKEFYEQEVMVMVDFNDYYDDPDDDYELAPANWVIFD